MKRCQCFSAAGLVLAGMILVNPQAAGQILRIGEMNTQQIQALNLPKTVVLIPGGILEEHGPYLPSYTDGYADDAYTGCFSYLQNAALRAHVEAGPERNEGCHRTELEQWSGGRTHQSAQDTQTPDVWPSRF